MKSGSIVWLKSALIALLALIAFSFLRQERQPNFLPAGTSLDQIKGKPIRSTNLLAVTTPVPATTNRTNYLSAPLQLRDGYFIVGFERLAAYPFEVPTENGPSTNANEAVTRQIPEPIRKLDGKSVAVRGFMLPLKVEGGLVTELLLMRDQSLCCYGAQPKMNEWISVKMEKQGVKAVMDEPITITGKLQVGEMRDNGWLVAIYKMDGHSLLEK
ncbi:MAG: DUF3299 domain-containing protein [Verrucomicrobiota bacterium]|nr:DUF3299 domain-containing protein [Verrucomicrobiota bacterium]